MDSSSKINILLVDDRPDGLLTLQAVLASPEYNLVTASSGQEALARLFDADYAVILLDVQMPGMDGFETAGIIKQLERARHVPIIFVTAISKEPKHILSGYEAGAVDYISKPFDPTVLRSKVAIFAELYRRKRQLEEQAERLRRSEERNRLLVDEARDVIATILPDLRISSLNPAFERLTGWRRTEWLGRSLLDLAHAEEAAVVREYFLGIGDIEPALFEFRMARANGGYFHAEVGARPVSDDNGGAIFIVIRDVTIRRQIEAERKRRDELERSNRDLQQFAHICSHDLQEPLRQMASFAQILRQRYRSKLDPEADEFIDHIVNGAVWMSSLVREILSYSRLESSPSSVETVSCDDVLAQVVKNLRLRIAELGAEITWDMLPVVNGNRAQLIQLFQNLIGNSLKFHATETPRVHVRAVRQREEWVIEIADNGIGFEMEFADRIFNVFQRLHRREEYPGTGMGLAICKRIVERHGGRIWAESHPGTGSVFYLTLPDCLALGENAPAGPTVRSGEQPIAPSLN